jgi:hypothetical protein
MRTVNAKQLLVNHPGQLTKRLTVERRDNPSLSNVNSALSAARARIFFLTPTSITVAARAA